MSVDYRSASVFGLLSAARTVHGRGGGYADIAIGHGDRGWRPIPSSRMATGESGSVRPGGGVRGPAPESWTCRINHVFTRGYAI